MTSIQALVQKKLNKRTIPKRKSMASHKSKSQTIVLRPSMRQAPRKSHRQSITSGFRGVKGSLAGIKRMTQPYAEALGDGTIAVALATRVKPDLTMGQAQMIGLAGEYVGGGVKGAIGAEVIKALLGAPSIFTNFSLGNLFGSGGGQQQMMQSGGGSALL